MKPKAIKLSYGERIIGVRPEIAGGPGWSNTPVWVFVATPDGRLREECLQPTEQTAAMRTLYAPGVAMAQALLNAVPVVRSKA